MDTPRVNRLVPPIGRIGKYRIDYIIGQGAVGIVYKGYDEQIDRDVAVKTLQPHIIADMATSKDALRRFSSEVRSAGRCLHPNIVTVFDYVEEDGAPYIIMEHVPAGTLEGVINAGVNPPLRQVGELMTQILLALEHAHGKGIVHRDVKPSNILCHSANAIKVADFGIAQISSLNLTSTGKHGVIGTPHYMAPERFLGRPDDGRGDLYSAGVILFQLLTRERPFKANDTHELMHKVINDMPIEARTIRGDLSPGMEVVIQKALARNPQDRFQTPGEFLTALRGAINIDGTDTKPTLDLTMFATITSVGTGTSPSRASISQTMADKLAPDTLSELERALARTIGPIAKVVVRRAAAEATDAKQLVNDLTRNLKTDSEIKSFRQLAEERLVKDGGIPGLQIEAEVSQAEAAAVIAALLPVLGPVTKPLIERTVKTAVGREDFYQRVARHLQRPEDIARLDEVAAKYRPSRS
jgi:eukaryotic-like serine/threonine-protein kinase